MVGPRQFPLVGLSLFSPARGSGGKNRAGAGGKAAKDIQLSLSGCIEDAPKKWALKPWAHPSSGSLERKKNPQKVRDTFNITLFGARLLFGSNLTSHVTTKMCPWQPDAAKNLDDVNKTRFGSASKFRSHFFFASSPESLTFSAPPNPRNVIESSAASARLKISSNDDS